MQVAVGGARGRRGALGSLCLVLLLGGTIRPADVRAPAPLVAPTMRIAPGASLPPPALDPDHVSPWSALAPCTSSPLSSGTLAIWQSVPGGPAMVRRPDVPLTRACGPFDPPPPGGVVACSPIASAIVVDPTRRFQTIAGFGGAFNERGWLALLTLSAPARAGVLRALFDPLHGAGYSLARAPIGASDYALDAYSLDDRPGDTTLQGFSIARDRLWLLPYIQAARAVAPDLALWASPWSAPAWMKTNGQMVHGGHLLERDEEAYARYLAAYVEAYAREGEPIVAISVQNEPSQSTEYPSMVMAPGQMARFVGRYLGPLFARLGLATRIRINEEPARGRWRYSLLVIADPRARRYIAGSDIHGYHGSPHDLTLLHRADPTLDIWQTEDTHLDHPHFEDRDLTRWGAEIARDLQNWASGWEYWNMVTDGTGMSSWGWSQDSVVVVDMATGVVRYTPKYAAMGQFSRFIRPGARRLGTSGVPIGVVATAAIDPDGRIVLVVVNARATALSTQIALGATRARLVLPAGAIATLVWT